MQIGKFPQIATTAANVIQEAEVEVYMFPDTVGGLHLPDALLSIGSVVSELQRSYPDVSHSSLRFLEREGLITAVRTPGGHRLYSPADIERIRQIKTWQAQRLYLDQIRQRLA